VPVTVAINRFDSDTDDEIRVVKLAAAEQGCEAYLCTHADGGKGCEELATGVAKLTEQQNKFMSLYTERRMNFRFYHYLFSAKCIESQFYLTALTGLIVKLF
jgi:formyltetrahydrofolate synthetase